MYKLQSLTLIEGLYWNILPLGTAVSEGYFLSALWRFVLKWQCAIELIGWFRVYYSITFWNFWFALMWYYYTLVRKLQSLRSKWGSFIFVRIKCVKQYSCNGLCTQVIQSIIQDVGWWPTNCIWLPRYYLPCHGNIKVSTQTRCYRRSLTHQRRWN